MEEVSKKGLSSVPLPQEGCEGKAAPLQGGLLAPRKSTAWKTACTLILLYTPKFLLVRTDCEAKKGTLQEHASWEHLHNSQAKVSHNGQKQACTLLLCQDLVSVDVSSNKYLPKVWLSPHSVWAPSEHTSADTVWLTAADNLIPTSTRKLQNMPQGGGSVAASCMSDISSKAINLQHAQGPQGIPAMSLARSAYM